MNKQNVCLYNAKLLINGKVVMTDTRTWIELKIIILNKECKKVCALLSIYMYKNCKHIYSDP